MTSIHQVILDGRLSQLNLLVNRLNANVNEKDSFGRTPLHLAALSDQEVYGYRVARLLLQRDADPNVTDAQQQSPIVYACLLNRSKLIPLFLRTKSIDWHLTDHDGWLIIHHAAASSDTSILIEIVHEMKSSNISIDTKTDLGYTPLILAIKASRFDNALYLLDNTDSSPFAIDDEYHYTCQQWVHAVGPKSTEWTSFNRQKTPPSNTNRRTRSNDRNIPNYKCFYGVESPYQCKMLVCNHHHVKSFEESTFTPTILSPRMKENKTNLSTQNERDKRPSKLLYQTWMQLVQRLHDRTLPTKPTVVANEETPVVISPQKTHITVSVPTTPAPTGLRRQRTWAGHDTAVSPWNSDKLNSNKQVITLINHYSNLLSIDNKDALTQRINDRPKSILRPVGTPNKYRFTKEVTFAAD